MRQLPSGTVTFLFTDIEGSTRLLQALGDRYQVVRRDHHELLRAAFVAHDGVEVQEHGDGLFFVFASARAAAGAALKAQRDLLAHAWPEGGRPRVRMGVHTGEAILAEPGYVGLDVHRAARICGAGWGGQILLSQTVCDLLGSDPPPGTVLRDLGAHRLKDLSQPERLFQLVHPDLPADFPPLRTLETLPNNLPQPLTSFIGREREMAEVKRLLSERRLVTLTGIGGSGKTRLAIQVGAELLEGFPDGVWMVDLAALADPSLVPQSVAAALGVWEEPNRPMPDVLTNALRDKRMLLVLDNCEHLIDACAGLAAALLRACPDIRLLATSREALRVSGETTYLLPSLSLPEANHEQHVKRLMASDAVRLFLDRARLNDPTFSIDARNASAVAEVCHRLDGIPLALELAAMRVRVLSVEQIARRLDDRFRLLAAGGRATLPRQQTLRAAIDWSYDLLIDQERRLLRRLSVFAGGFALEAAEGICAGNGVKQEEVLDLLARLVDKSLVVTAQSGEGTRYYLLDTVRAYAREKLEQSSEAAQAGARHRDWFLALAERAETELAGVRQPEWLATLEQEIDNLRAALDWCRARQDDAEIGMRLATALWYFWASRGYFSEARGWLEGAFGAVGASARLRTKALFGAGVLAYYQGDYERAAGIGEEGLALSRAAGDDAGAARSSLVLGLASVGRGDYQRAAVCGEEALRVFRAGGDRWGAGASLLLSATAAQYRGDYATADRLLQESLALFREIGDPRQIALASGNLGVLARFAGQHDRATALLREGLGHLRALGDRWGVGYMLGHLGLVALARRDVPDAEALFRESLTLRWRIGDRRGVAQSLAGLGGVAHERAAFAKAARLLGASHAVRSALQAAMAPADQAEFDRTVQRLRDRLGDSAFEDASAEGQRLALADVVREALEEEPP